MIGATAETEEQMRDDSYSIGILGLAACLYGLFTLLGNLGLMAL